MPKGGHHWSRGIYEHGERSRPTISLIGAMFSGFLAVFFFSFFGVLSFVWVLRSDPVARNFLHHLIIKISSFGGKFLKLYFACTLLYNFDSKYKVTQNIILMGIFHSFKNPKLLWSRLVKSKKEWEKH